MEAAASKDKRISPNENNLSLSCKGVCQNYRLVRRGYGIARFSFDTLPTKKTPFRTASSFYSAEVGISA